jgi:hypothetical protein
VSLCLWVQCGCCRLFLPHKSTVLASPPPLPSPLPCAACCRTLCQYFDLPVATVTFIVATVPNPDGSVNIELMTDKVAVYVAPAPANDRVFPSRSHPSASPPHTHTPLPGLCCLGLVLCWVRGSYVVLTTLAHGRFSDNAFLLLPGNTIVTFVPFAPLDLPTLTSTLRVEHVAQYL